MKILRKLLEKLPQRNLLPNAPITPFSTTKKNKHAFKLLGSGKSLNTKLTIYSSCLYIYFSIHLKHQTLLLFFSPIICNFDIQFYNANYSFNFPPFFHRFFLYFLFTVKPFKFENIFSPDIRFTENKEQKFTANSNNNNNNVPSISLVSSSISCVPTLINCVSTPAPQNCLLGSSGINATPLNVVNLQKQLKYDDSPSVLFAAAASASINPIYDSNIKYLTFKLKIYYIILINS